MHCPNPSCYESPERPHLLISERSGIEIDYCPKCRGVWLDRGELDKLIERAQDEATAAPAQREPARDYRPQHQDQHYRAESQYREPHYKDQRKHYDDDHKHHHYGHYGKKKKSILSEIFDF